MGVSLLSWPDRTVETGTILSGGSWRSSFPLDNLKDKLMSKVARSSNALSTSTLFTVSFSGSKKVRVIGLLGHNFTKNGSIRIRGYISSPASPGYDSGGVSLWPSSLTDEQISQYPNNFILALPQEYDLPNWLIEISDTSNPAGYIEMGRCWLGPAFQPTFGVAYGAGIGYEQRTTITESLGGVPWPDVKLPRRAATITFPSLTPLELRTAIIFQKTVGNSGEIIYVQNYTQSAEDMLLFAFPAMCREVNKITLAAFESSEFPVGLLELI